MEGIGSVIIGVLIFFFLPDYPETAKFLNEDEKHICLKRLGKHVPKMSDSSFDKKVFIQVISSWHFWLFVIMYFLITHGLNSFSYFGPSIISNLGFDGISAQLMTVPPNAFALIIISEFVVPF